MALVAVRNYLLAEGLDAIIIGTGDAHKSEYVSKYDDRRSFVSGFTGSAGTVLITKDKALLWTDGRYFLQASQELSPDWTLMKSGVPGVPELENWVNENLPSGSSVGVDPFLISSTDASVYQKAWNNIKLVGIERNPVDDYWNSLGTRPEKPANKVMIHSLEYAGKTYQEKIEDVRAKFTSSNVDAFVVSMLDEIAYLLNIRGSDILFNPVAISYVIITRTLTYFFVDDVKITADVREYFDPNVVVIRPYDEIVSFLQGFDGSKIMFDPSQLNWKISMVIGDRKVEKSSPITLMKSLKNDAELSGIYQAHIRDGVALTAFIAWLTKHVQENPNAFSESDAAKKLEEFRSKMPFHVGPSFRTISGYGSNGAIIHYTVQAETAKLIGLDSFYLLDSGAQYLDGTTDVTRTMTFGDVSQHMKDCYTMVLKGHIALAKCVFPEGITGSRLDSFARQALWSVGLDYNHGTGHGVGAYLNVHEGPQGISFRDRPNECGFSCGMTVSNEPGYYEDGSFGIRIENICVSTRAETRHNFMGRNFCRFENATLVPIQTSCLNMELLEESDIMYLNAYHDQVRDKCLPLMEQYFPEAVEFLKNSTSPIAK